MGRILFRLLVVLLAVAVVAAGLYAFSATSLAQSLVPERGGDPPIEQVDEGMGATVRRHGPPEQHEQEERGFSLVHALPGIGEHLMIIGLMIIAVVLMRKGIGMLRIRWSSQCC